MENSTQKQIIQEEIARYDNTIYLWSVRARVAIKIEDKAMEDSVKSEMEKCVKAMDVLNEELKSLDRV
jgi:hypothetical protein